MIIQLQLSIIILVDPMHFHDGDAGCTIQDDLQD